MEGFHGRGVYTFFLPSPEGPRNETIQYCAPGLKFQATNLRMKCSISIENSNPDLDIPTKRGLAVWFEIFKPGAKYLFIFSFLRLSWKVRKIIHHHREKPPLFLFQGVRQLWCIPFFPDLWCIPFSLVFPRKMVYTIAFFAL